MIATTADTETHERYVANIVKTYRAADADQRRRGADWYPAAHQIASLMSEGNVRAGAGVLAALSPQKAWYLNVRIAEESLASGTAKGNVGDAIGKAQRIMNGEDPLEVLPDESKSWNFFRAILDPSDPDVVVVDRHAHDICAGEVYGSKDRGLSSKRRYATLAHAYREAARKLGEIPSVVQATSWVHWTESVVGVLPRRPGTKNIH